MNCGGNVSLAVWSQSSLIQHFVRVIGLRLWLRLLHIPLCPFLLPSLTWGQRLKCLWDGVVMLVWRGLTPSEDLTGALLFFFSNPHSEWAHKGESPQS